MNVYIQHKAALYAIPVWGNQFQMGGMYNGKGMKGCLRCALSTGG